MERSMMEEKFRVHPTAEVSPQAEIGEGTSIWHHAQVRERAVIGKGCILGKGVYVDFDVIIGDHCKLQNGVFVYHPATIHDGVFLGPGVIITNDKRPRAVNPDMSLKSQDDWQALPVVIGQGAAVGAGSVLLPAVDIGQWAMVGANSVVTHHVPDYGLVLGNPARLIGFVCPCGTRVAPEKASGTFTCHSCGTRIHIQGTNHD
jgi:acetyltransferase-like isoleucine patch superfamily enzyme